jgi:hypothetical protein
MAIVPVNIAFRVLEYSGKKTKKATGSCVLRLMMIMPMPAERTNERTNERFAFCVIIWRDRQVAPKKTAGKDTTETCVSQWLERENDKNYGSENRIGTAGRVPGILFH